MQIFRLFTRLIIIKIDFMLFLLPIIILSVVLLTWTFMMSSIILGIFPIFSHILTVVSLVGTFSFLMGIVGANVWPRPFYSRLYFY